MAKKPFNLDVYLAKALREPKPRRRRGKSEADIWFEKMKADYIENGAAHLASAKAKLEGGK